MERRKSGVLVLGRVETLGFTGPVASRGARIVVGRERRVIEDGVTASVGAAPRHDVRSGVEAICAHAVAEEAAKRVEHRRI